jgi:NADH dehydrogenase (ubiquinone) 1 alpha subcomplex subunit 5
MAGCVVVDEYLDPTGITGLYTHPNPRPALIALYDATLKKLEDFPSTSVYRQSVENITKSRKEIVEKNEIREVIEEKVGAGLIEEVLVQAGEELELIKVLGKEQPWENLMEEPHPDQWKAFDKEL